MRDPNKYKKYADFQRRVLDDSIEEINRYTDINVEILEAKKIKRVVYALVFRISFKTQVLDKDNNPVDLSENDLSPALFSYSHGASKPKFKAELLKRVNINCADEKEKQVWDMLQNRYAALANRHTKEDRRIDGGNVQYIDLFNEMIEKDRLESFINAQLDKYASRQWENLLEERAVSNPDAYTRACVKNDIESWQEFLNRSEKTFYETSLADTPEWDISVPKFKVD